MFMWVPQPQLPAPRAQLFVSLDESDYTLQTKIGPAGKMNVLSVLEVIVLSALRVGPLPRY